MEGALIISELSLKLTAQLAVEEAAQAGGGSPNAPASTAKAQDVTAAEAEAEGAEEALDQQQAPSHPLTTLHCTYC